MCVLSHFSHFGLFVTPRIVDCQDPLSMGFSRQEYWSGLPFPFNKWSVNTDRVKQELSQGCLFPQPRLCSGVCVRVCV